MSILGLGTEQNDLVFTALVKISTVKKQWQTRFMPFTGHRSEIYTKLLSNLALQYESKGVWFESHQRLSHFTASKYNLLCINMY